MLNPEFSQKLNQVSSNLGMNPRDLLLVMYFESGLNPSAINPHGNATGLIQFMPNTLKGMGLSPEEIKNFKNKSALDQLDFVSRYIQGKASLVPGGKFSSATQYYHANFFPKTLKRWRGTDPYQNSDKIVVSVYSKDPLERAAYSENSVLDTNKDGVITVGDLTSFLNKQANSSGFKRVLNQFNSEVGDGTVSEFNNQNMMAANETGNMGKNPSNFDKVLDEVANFFQAADTKHNVIIKISSSNSDASAKIEFARILKISLKHNNINSEIYSNNNEVELGCSSNDLNKLDNLCFKVANAFDKSTNVKIYSMILTNSSTIYEPLSIKLSDINYRKFRLKLITNNLLEKK